MSGRMARRVGDPVEVRVAGDQGGTPMSFLWHERLYVVREVLGYWRERREWWAAAAGRAVHGDERAFTSGAQATLEHEREVWRVEASAGRIYGNGVYELTREPAVDPPVTGEWRLARIAD